MHVLVTGGAGFIGSHLVRRLASDRNISVTVLDNLHRGRLEDLADCLEDIWFLEADIRDSRALREAMSGVDIVYHLAAQSSVMNSASDASYTLSTNVAGTSNVLQAAKFNKVKRVVFASSREVYGDPAHLPVHETAPLKPKNSYGASKATGETYCDIFGVGLEAVILRLANVYGPGDRDRVIPIFIESALEGRPLQLYGGDQILDFVWIGTVVEALMTAGFGDLIEGPLNIGSGKGTTISELAQRILDLTGSRSQVNIAPSRQVEVSRFVADVSRAKRLIGLRPPEDPLFGLEGVVERTRASIPAGKPAVVYQH
jgi:UDP-glucose 4-epimerase